MSALAPYVYRATVTRVVDGDTCRLAVQLGFGIVLQGEDGGGLAVRLLGCNAREMHDPGGPEAKANLEALLPPGTPLTIRTMKPDKFGGRYDAAVEVPSGADLVTLLITGGWVAAWDGRGARPLPPWPRSADPIALETP